MQKRKITEHRINYYKLQQMHPLVNFFEYQKIFLASLGTLWTNPIIYKFSKHFCMKITFQGKFLH